MINILGLAGSGKSTQGQLLAKRLDCPWISMGELLRQKGDPQIQEAMLKGEIVDIHKTLSLLGRDLEEKQAHIKEVVVDGWPRTLEQATWMVQKVKEGAIMPTGVIHLKAHDEVARERLMHRGRKDDNEQSIIRRFNDYKHNILPILNFLKDNGLPIYEINADDKIEDVELAIDKCLGIR